MSISITYKLYVTKRDKAILSVLVMIALILVIYWPVQSYDFINYDDNIYITGNDLIKNFSFQVFSDIIKSYSNDGLPLTLISFTIDYKLFGLNPVPYHIENLIFHLIKTI